MQKDLLIIGCAAYVSAIDTSNGQEVWRTMIRKGWFGGSSGNLVSVLIDGDRIFAGCAGLIFCLRKSDGTILWENSLRGMGHGEVSLARQGTHTQFITRTVTNNTTT